MGFEEDWQDLVLDGERIPNIGIAVGGLDGDVRTAGDGLLFPACSISKHVAAFGTLRLVADARIDLDTHGEPVPSLRQILRGEPAELVASRRQRILDGSAVDHG